ncbi:MAG: sigma 54-interacting transcriptional regulator, partial [Candidatus Thermoplasmatota archaeon]|nr:sigma 54-interacting transcriptional regulator [Candidatus Thermoplasmatota archaeon]
MLLEIKNLKTYFYTYEGVVRALEDTNLKIYAGETFGLIGETGCGKDLLAKKIHLKSKYRKGPFIKVNMPDIPRDLIESTLFG